MLEVRIRVAESCACSEISGLMTHKGPVDAMIHFCMTELVSAKSKFTPEEFKTLASFYIFVAGPEVPGHGWSSKTWTKYGTEFAEYITQNGLGMIATLDPRLNLKYHPSTTCQVWLWAPNQKALQAWWKDAKEKGLVPEPSAPTSTLTVVGGGGLGVHLPVQHGHNVYVAALNKIRQKNPVWDVAWGVTGQLCAGGCGKRFERLEPILNSSVGFRCKACAVKVGETFNE